MCPHLHTGGRGGAAGARAPDRRVSRRQSPGSWWPHPSRALPSMGPVACGACGGSGAAVCPPGLVVSPMPDAVLVSAAPSAHPGRALALRADRSGRASCDFPSEIVRDQPRGRTFPSITDMSLPNKAVCTAGGPRDSDTRAPRETVTAIKPIDTPSVSHGDLPTGWERVGSALLAEFKSRQCWCTRGRNTWRGCTGRARRSLSCGNTLPRPAWAASRPPCSPRVCGRTAGCP